MATYDATVGGISTTTAATEIHHADFGKVFLLKRKLTIATLREDYTTPAANDYFTIADVIQILDWPARCVPIMCITEVVTASTAAATADVGFAGTQDLEAGFVCNATAGTVTWDLYTEGAYGANFIAGDTIDFEVLTANLADGVFNIFILGIDLGAQ